MKKSILLSLIFLGMAVGSAYSQRSYTRNSLSIIYLDFSSSENGLRSQMMQVPIPDKFDDNTIETRSISLPIARPDITVDPLGYRKAYNALPAQIQEALEANKVGTQIMALWYNLQRDGSLDMSLIQQRGIYSVTDSDVITASASQKGDALLKDVGENLLKKSYILVVDVHDVEQNNSDDMNGYSCNANGYLYKVVFNDSVQSIIYNNLWVNSTDDQSIKAERRGLFASTNFGLEFIMTTSLTGVSVSSTSKSGGELLNELAIEVRDKLIRNFENKVSDLVVKSGIATTGPVGAKIGLKEGLVVDQRYFVMQSRERNSGKKYEKRMAVVRAKKVKDNRYVAEGKTDTSFFYQTAGKKVDKYSMYLVQKNDFGIGVIPMISIGEMGGYGGRLEFNLSYPMAKAMKAEKFPTSLKTYADVAFESKAYPFVYENTPEYIDFLRANLGFGKDFHFLRYFHFGLYGSFGLEWAFWDEMVEKESLMTYLVNGGALFGMNLLHNVKLVGMASYNVPLLEAIYKDQNGNEVDLGGLKWSDVFENREGLMLSLGIKMQF